MSRQAMVVDSRSFIVAIDDPPPVAERWSALAVGLVVDEETGRTAATPMAGRSPRPGVSVTASGDGSFCLVARPWLACPPLIATSHSVGATLVPEGYMPVELTVTVPSHQRQIVAPAPAVGSPVLTLDNATNLVASQLLAIGPAATEERARILHLGPGPQQLTLDGGLGLAHNIGDPVVADAWTPIDLGAVPLRRQPIVIRGRAVRRHPATNTVTAVPNGAISVVDFWTSLAAVRAQLPGKMTDPNPAARAFIVSVSPGLVAVRDVGPGHLARQDFTAVAGDDRLLVAFVPAGATSCRVSSRQGIVAGSFLRVDPDHGDVAETVTVTDVTGFGPPDQPGDVTLALPLRGSHRAGVRVLRLTPQPPVPAVALRRDARPGDRALFVADITTLPDGIDAQLGGGAPPFEYQRLRRIEATTDADGYFRFPALHRVAALFLHITAPPLSLPDFMFYPDYAPRENWLDVVFP